MKAPFMQGEKIYLRGMEREDLPRVVEWLNDEEVTRYMIMGAFPTNLEVLTEQWEQEVRSGKDAVFSIVAKVDDKLVGWCGLYNIRPISLAAEFRVFIGDKDSWNKGYGTEVAKLLIRYGFDKLHLNKIFLGVNASYEAAVRAYEKAGFVREGVLRQEIFRNNRYYDAVRMSILRQEYEH